MKRALAVAASLCLLHSFGSPSALAQGVQTGTLRGTIMDAQSGVLPGATVTVSSPALQGQRSVTTETDGSYVLRSLPPGDYTVAFTLEGFKREEHKVAIPLGGEVERNVAMGIAGVIGTVTVVAELPAPLTIPTVGLNIKREEVEALATSRTLQGITTLSPGLSENTPNTIQVVINGAFAFDNVFMLNGVDVNDNLFGSPQNLFIEDAIQETQVLTSGISAEYGRFSGGVVNAITKSGGNTFSGSYRLNLTNPSWVSETPFEREGGVEHQSKISPAHEFTLGGPLLRDRLWFFAAGRLSNTSNSTTLDQTSFAYTQKDDNKRGEIKVTATPVANHTFQGGYLNNKLTQTDRPSFGFSIDQFTLGNRTLPNWYAFGSYHGIIGRNLLAEAQYSERRFGFRGRGGSSTSILESPFITLTQNLGHYNAPYFDANDPENRNNRQFTGTMTSFVNGAGRHEIKWGYEWFRSQLTGGNSQTATSYVFDADYATDIEGNPVFDSSGHLIPIFVPGATLLENWIAQRGSTLNVDNGSFYARDHWTFGRNLSFDMGLRYERVRSEATGGIIGVDTDTFVPRLAASYDPEGKGRFVLHATYGHYAGRYNEAQISGNTNVGNPDETIGRYRGPAGQGRSFAPGFDPANYQIVFGEFPTANVSFEDGLSSPITKEFTVSGGGSVGRTWAEASFVWRSMSNIIDDYIDRTNGFTEVIKNGIDYGRFTNSVFRNSDLPIRRYQGLVLQGRHALRSNWMLNANWTIQLKNEGNDEGEAPNQPGVPSQLGDYPEVFVADRHFPIGHLPGFQRHRARVWSVYDMDLGARGRLGLGGLLRVDSGASFSYLATGVPLTDIQEELLTGYPDAPSKQDIYFGPRGAGSFPGFAALDISINYDIPVFRSVRPWLKLDFFNITGNDRLIGYDTTITPDPNSPLDALGLPTGYIKDPTFGTASSNTNFPGSQTGLNGEITRGRAFRMALGIRF